MDLAPERPSSLGAMLRRTVQRVPEKVAMRYPTKEGFRDLTYRDLYSTVERYAAAYRRLGVKRGDRVCILSENCMEWAHADWGALCQGIVVVPLYPTLPADQVEYIVRDCGATHLIFSTDEQAAKLTRLPELKTIRLTGPDSLEELGKAEAVGDLEAEIDATQPEDLATIIYTSGTTGLPKGAMMPHRAFVHVCEAADRFTPLNESDTFLSFLPMSHVYERVAGQCLPICLGATIAYSKNLASLSGDMLKVKPTVMLCVPRFLESFRDRAIEGVGKQPPFRQKLFHLAISQGVRKANGEFAPLVGLLDKLVMGKLRERLGGRMRFFVSGGAALPRHVAEFFMGSGLTVLQGWGLTETSGGTCINHPDRNRYWTVGEPLDMEIRIAEDGEILVRGPALMQGYLNLPEETAKAIDADGWFSTGDIGEFEGFSLKITDRKKDILVLGNGKNVAPQPVENKLRGSAYIAEAVVVGDGMDACAALLVPNDEAVRKALSLDASVSLADSAEVRKLLKREVDAVNKTLANYEAVKRFAVLEKPFSIEAGELTPTLKVKRKVVTTKFAEIIAGLK